MFEMNSVESTLKILKQYADRVRSGDYRIELEFEENLDNLVYDRVMELIRNGSLDSGGFRKLVENGVARIRELVLERLEKQLNYWLRTIIKQYVDGSSDDIAQLINSGILTCGITYEPVYSYDDILVDTYESVVCKYMVGERDRFYIESLVDEAVGVILGQK